MRAPKASQKPGPRHSGLRLQRAVGVGVVHSGAETETAISSLGRVEVGPVIKPPLIFDCQEFRH